MTCGRAASRSQSLLISSSKWSLVRSHWRRHQLAQPHSLKPFELSRAAILIRRMNESKWLWKGSYEAETGQNPLRNPVRRA